MQAPALALTLRPGENAEEMLRAELEQQLSYQVCLSSPVQQELLLSLPFRVRSEE